MHNSTPKNTRPVRPLPGMANNVPRLARQPVRSLDGVRPVRPVPRPAPPKNSAPGQVTPAPKPKPAAASKPRKKPSRLQMPLLVLAIVAGGFLIQQSAIIGEICIVVYAIVVLKQKIAARLTFILALLAFVGVLVLLLFQANQTLAANFALYAFLLLAVGSLSLLREQFNA